MRGLVVANGLSHDGIAVLMVVPKSGDAVVCGIGGGVDADFCVIIGAHYQFFTPVAEDVGNGTGIVLRIIVCLATCSVEDTAVSSFVDGSCTCVAAWAVEHLVK